MDFKIETWPKTLVIGKSLKMSVAQNKTKELWQPCVPELLHTKHRTSVDMISLQVYPADYSFIKFNPNTAFTKWACVSVSQIQDLPPGYDFFTIPSGLYVVFSHKGLASNAGKTFGYIYGEWLPNSVYAIDNRPHFEVLGRKYKNNSIDSEEDIWIPIKPRK